MTIIFLGALVFIAYKAYDIWRLNEAEKRLANPKVDYNFDFSPPTYLKAVERMYKLFPEEGAEEENNE